MPRQYSPQFRQRVLGLLAEGRSVGQLAAELGIGAATFYRWQRQDRIDAGELPGPNTAQSAELAELTGTKLRTRHCSCITGISYSRAKAPKVLFLPPFLFNTIQKRGGDRNNPSA